MTSRKMYLFAMVLVPVACALFFISLLEPGLPLRTPVAVVDLDHSELSRRVVRNLNALELLDVQQELDSYDRALESVRRGETFGFLVIPANFEAQAINGNGPTIEYYSNMTYFVPGTLAFKGFKTIAVGTSGSLVTAKLQALGLPASMTGPMVQPMAVQEHPVANPWMSYSIYLCPSFIAGILALMVLLTTGFSISMELKNGTSPQWLETAGGSMRTALLGKLLPQFVVFGIVGMFCLSLLFGWNHFPLNGSIWWISLAMLMMIAACQCFAVFAVSLLPNPRLSFTLLALTGILSFSITGFSFPVENMYGGIAIFSYIIPVRYFFLIYLREAFNGWPVWYCRWYFLALAAFIPVGCSLLWRLKKACLKPVYVP